MAFLQQLPVSSVLLYSIVAAAVSVYLPFLAVGYGRFQVGYDTATPRALFDKLPPWAQRATWAHENCFEAFILFSAAALMAYVTGVDSSWATVAAIAHVMGRIFYSGFYIANIPIGRSLMFAIGTTSTITLFVLSLLTLPGMA